MEKCLNANCPNGNEPEVWELGAIGASKDEKKGSGVQTLWDAGSDGFYGEKR